MHMMQATTSENRQNERVQQVYCLVKNSNICTSNPEIIHEANASWYHTNTQRNLMVCCGIPLCQHPFMDKCYHVELIWRQATAFTVLNQCSCAEKALD